LLSLLHLWLEIQALVVHQHMAVLVDLVMEVLLVGHQHMVVSKEDMDNFRPSMQLTCV